MCHKRTLLKVLIIAVEYVEAFVVAARGDVHIRVLRCLRPFFLVDCYITCGVRRCVCVYVCVCVQVHVYTYVHHGVIICNSYHLGHIALVTE